jgi:hypothetical protein
MEWNAGRSKRELIGGLQHASVLFYALRKTVAAGGVLGNFTTGRRFHFRPAPAATQKTRTSL